MHDRLWCFFLLKVPEKKGTLKKDHPVSLKNQDPLDSTQGSKEKSTWKTEPAQVRTDLREGPALVCLPL